MSAPRWPQPADPAGLPEVPRPGVWLRLGLLLSSWRDPRPVIHANLLLAAHIARLEAERDYLREVLEVHNGEALRGRTDDLKFWQDAAKHWREHAEHVQKSAEEWRELATFRREELREVKELYQDSLARNRDFQQDNARLFRENTQLKRQLAAATHDTDHADQDAPEPAHSNVTWLLPDPTDQPPPPPDPAA